MPLIVIGLSHHSSPVTVRERFAFADAAIPEVLQKLRASGIATEAVILSTCNRVEIYAASDLPEQQALAAAAPIPSRTTTNIPNRLARSFIPTANSKPSNTCSGSPADWTRWCWVKRRFSAS